MTSDPGSQERKGHPIVKSQVFLRLEPGAASAPLKAQCRGLQPGFSGFYSWSPGETLRSPGAWPWVGGIG